MQKDSHTEQKADECTYEENNVSIMLKTAFILVLTSLIILLTLKHSSLYQPLIPQLIITHLHSHITNLGSR